VLADERDRLARLARYMARAPLPDARVREGPDGRLLVRTAPDPRTVFEPRAEALPRRGRGRRGARGEGGPARRGAGVREGAPPLLGAAPAEADRGRSPPLPEVRRRDEGRRGDHVAVITDPAVIDRILAHLEAGGGKDPFDARAPPEG